VTELAQHDSLTVDSFYESANNGELIGLKCESGHITIPPRISCRICGKQELHRIVLSGRGQVVSFTEVFVKSKEFPVDVPYFLALVRLEEGGNLLGVFHSVSKPEVGMKVLTQFRQLGPTEQKWPRIFFQRIECASPVPSTSL